MQSKQSQQDFNSICFHRKCISKSNQLFLSTPHSVSPHQDHSKPHTRPLHRNSLFSKFLLPNRLIKVRLKRLVRECNRDFDEMIDSLVPKLKKKYKDVSLKQAKRRLQQLCSKGSANLINRLRKKSSKLRDDDLEILNVLNQGQTKDINHLIEKKLRPITSSTDTFMKSLADKFFQVIPAHFGQLFEQKDEVKMEQEEQSRSEQLYFAASSSPQEQVNLQPIQEEKIEKEGEESLKTRVKRRRNKLKQLDLVEFQRTRTRKNYLQLHKYGRIPVDEKFDTFVIDNISQLRQLMREDLIRPCNLAVNCEIDTEVLTEAINVISPLRIILNTNFQHEHFFDKIQPSVLDNLLALEQGWCCKLFFEEYMSSIFFPTKSEQDLQKLRIPVGVWKKLSKIQSICISKANDLYDLKRSKKSLKQMRSLQIQPCPQTKQAFPLDILHQTSSISLLETLVFRKFNLTEQYIGLVVQILQRNKQIQALVFEGVDSLPQEIVKEFCKLPLNKLVVHLKSEGNFDLSFIAEISSLEYLSLKNVRPSYKKKSPSFKLKHLDLYNCGKDCQDVIQYLCGQSPRTLTHLTVAKNTLSDNFGAQLKTFSHLTYLNMDHSSLNIRLFLNTLNKSMIQLQKLSLLGFLDTDDNNFEEESVPILTEEVLENILHKHFPKLAYLNLSSEKSIIKAKSLHSGPTLCLKGVKLN